MAATAPKAGTPSQKVPQKSVPSKPAVQAKAVSAGVAKPVVKQAAPVVKLPYALPIVDPALVVRLFENVPEYKQYKIRDLDTLIRGMLHLATQPIRGVGPGGLPATSTPFDNFVASLMQMAVEKGSKGIVRNS